MALRKSLVNVLDAARLPVIIVLSILLLFPPITARPQAVGIGGVRGDGEEEFAIPDSCQDFDGQECQEFAANRECENNPAFMEVACQRTCGTCKPSSRVKGCSDQRQECQAWGTRGECDVNAAFMNVNCPATCDTCPPAAPEDCVDQHQYCFLGSLLGLCRTNPSFFLIFCPDSCRKFVSVCREGRSSTVRDLCSSQNRGQDLDCGTDPTVAAVGRKGVPHTPSWTNRGRAMTKTPEGTGGLFGNQHLNHSDALYHIEKIDSTDNTMNEASPARLLGEIGKTVVKAIEEILWKFVQNSLEKEALGWGSLKYRNTTPAGVAEGRERFADRDSSLNRGLREKEEAFGLESLQVLSEVKHRTRRQDGPISICEVSVTGFEFLTVDVCTGVIGISIVLIFLCQLIGGPEFPEFPEGPETSPIPPVFPTLTFPPSPTPTPSPSTTPSPSPSTTPSPSPSPSPSPPTSSLPGPSVQTRVRSMVPYCTGAGYLNLVQRLKRLVNRNTGRPLSPEAASLALAVNFCMHGVGSPQGTVGSVPEAPAGFLAPSAAEILLDDEEAKESLKAPNRWPGISHPALYLYQEGGVPPPPPAANATIITTITVDGVVVSNNTEVSPGDGGSPDGGATGDGGVTGDGSPTGDGGVTGDGSTTGDGGGGDDVQRGPRPVTEETLADRKAFSCGGALISPFHVLTAAHCLIDPGLTKAGRTTFSKPSVVRLGEVDFEQVGESQAFDYDVEGIQVHEGYALPAKYSDIAIITLKNKVEFTSALRPFCLPQQTQDLVGRVCTVSGWGRTQTGTLSTVLHNVQVEVVSQQECESVYTTDENTRPFIEVFYPQGFSQVLLCAGKISDVCRGDSGGPLVLEEGGVMQEVGIVSNGYGCGTTQYPGIYTKVDQFTSWVDDEVYGGCLQVL